VTRRNFGDIAAFAKEDCAAEASRSPVVGEVRDQRSGGRRAGLLRRGLLALPWEKAPSIDECDPTDCELIGSPGVDLGKDLRRIAGSEIEGFSSLQARTAALEDFGEIVARAIPSARPREPREG
jgi:hypothetical protein